MTVRTLLADLRRRLEAHLDRADARREASLVLAHATGLDRAAQVRDPDATVAPEAAARARHLADQRAQGVPLAYLTGVREFWGLPVAVGPGVLVPRPETETLVEAALRHLPATRDARILDLGTGSGCLLLAVLHERPRAWGIGVDRSPVALGYAQRNARALGLGDRAAFVRGDWGQAIGGRFDLVLANPPYVARPDLAALMVDVRCHEPREALDGGSDGLACYRRLLPELADQLARGGAALVEIGDDQADAVIALAEASGLARPSVVRDLAGRPRCLVVGAG